jgi:hypothetical protein
VNPCPDVVEAYLPHPLDHGKILILQQLGMDLQAKILISRVLSLKILKTNEIGLFLALCLWSFRSV